jgi:hypothetical protein
MAYIRVAYKKKDVDFDYVPGERLEALIAGDEITHFFRPAEKRWVSVKFDAVRGGGGNPYPGPERRKNDPLTRAAGAENQSSSANEGIPAPDWLASLWRRVEKS